MILTSKGYLNIKSLENQNVDIWNGEEFSKVTVKKTGTNQKIMEITFSNGSVLKCTPYHKFYLIDDAKNQKNIEVEAKNLNIGDRLIKTKYPIIIEGLDNNELIHDVPVNCNLNIKLEWLEKTINFNYDDLVIENNLIQLTSFNRSFLDNFKYMLQTLGCNPNVTLALNGQDNEIIKMNNEDLIEIPRLDLYHLTINSNDMYQLINLGLKIQNIDLSTNHQPDTLISEFIQVTSVKHLDEVEDTYCFNEPKRHMGIFNGIPASQCSEILEVSSNDEYAVCFPEDTEIITKNGIKKIIDCDGEDVLSYFDNDINLNKKPHYECAQLMHNGIKTVYAIETNKGIIEATINHPFLVSTCSNKYEWRMVSKLKIGDQLVRIDSKTIPQIDNLDLINTSSILSIKEIGEKNVYDLALKTSHNFIANNHVVHNCNLASICLPKYIKHDDSGKPYYDYNELYRVTRIIGRNLDNIIDINYYPVEEAKKSNLKHRPIGIGVQGLADVFAIFKTPFDSDLARDLNKKIFETIYFGAMTESMILAKEKGPYQTFFGSPMSQGKFQFDLWGIDRKSLSGMWDWDSLEIDIKKWGTRNSLTTTCMPTASTSQIMQNNETTEPYTENIYTRTTIAGDHYIVNKYLMKDLMELDLWNSDMVNLIKYHKGSIMNIPSIPDNIKKIYRTVWEIPQKSVIEMAAERGPFIEQTQSMNIFIAKPDFKKLNSCLFYAWKKGLKTGIYYLRSKAASEADSFGIDIDIIKKIEDEQGKSENKCETSDVDVFAINQDMKSPDIAKMVNERIKKLNNHDEEKNTPQKQSEIFCKYNPKKSLKENDECLMCSS